MHGTTAEPSRTCEDGKESPEVILWYEGVGEGSWRSGFVVVFEVEDEVDEFGVDVLVEFLSFIFLVGGTGGVGSLLVMSWRSGDEDAMVVEESWTDSVYERCILDIRINGLLEFG
jgi:hypothetical protein